MMVASRVQLHEQLCGIFIDYDPSFLLGIVETVRLKTPCCKLHDLGSMSARGATGSSRLS